ncbi:hypothetical protein [Bradyrhizobium sp. RDM4]|uniref:hypothetical protein n=1 Tax=Bradyrhizobium sp. RDM4 TaxID=3378765 RepID=UPI0038FCB1DF
MPRQAPWRDEAIPQGREVSLKQSVFSVAANQRGVAIMLNMLLDAIYGEVISASIPGMKTLGAGSTMPSTAATNAAWLTDLIETLDNVAALPAPHQSAIDACHARLRLPSTPVQPTLH